MKRVVYLLFSVLFLLIFSCSRDLVIGPLDEAVLESAYRDELTEVARQYYQARLKERMEAGLTATHLQVYSRAGKGLPDTSAANNNVKVYAKWDQAITVEIGGVVRTEAPLSYSRRMVSLIHIARDSVGERPDQSMVRKIFDRLVIVHRRGGFTQKVIRFHPDKSYLDRHGFDASHNYLHRLDGDFTGYLEYLTATGERTAIVRVVDGRPVKRYFGSQSELMKAYKSKSSK